MSEPYTVDETYTRSVRVNCGQFIIAEFNGPEGLANVRLFVATPDLLECLTDAVDRMLGSSTAITALRNRSLAAIDKARGAAKREST